LLRRVVMSERRGDVPLPVGAVAPFDGQPGVWLRCALHAHTTGSDGWLTPTMLRRYHAIAGFDVLAITDHDHFTPAPGATTTYSCSVGSS
jgi:hypothetical protein